MNRLDSSAVCDDMCPSHESSLLAVNHGYYPNFIAANNYLKLNSSEKSIFEDTSL